MAKISGQSYHANARIGTVKLGQDAGSIIPAPVIDVDDFEGSADEFQAGGQTPRGFWQHRIFVEAGNNNRDLGLRPERSKAHSGTPDGERIYR